MIIPIGHEEMTFRKLPWVSIGIALICVVVQLGVAPRGADTDRERDEASATIRTAQEDLRQMWLRENEARAARGQAPIRGQDFANAVREGGVSPEADEVRDRIESARARLDRIAAEPPGYALAYRPGVSGPLRMITCAFAHGGWMHLLGNMLFLWLVGLNLEDRWGRLRFLAFYLAGAFASSLAFRLLHPGGPGLIGASGAIAAAMGAFTVIFAKTRIRFAYFFFFGLRPRYGTFAAPAWIALLVWFAEQLLMARVEAVANVGVAYSAHVGGFAMGLATAGLLRVTGIDRRLEADAAAASVVFEADPALVAATISLEGGRPAEALAKTEELLARHPEHVEGFELGLRAARASDATGAARLTGAAVAHASHAGDHRGVVDRWTLARRTVPEAPHDPETLQRVITAARREGETVAALDAVAEMHRHHARAPQAPRAYWIGAELYEGAGRPDLARVALRALVTHHPGDALADQARRKLDALGG